MDVHFLKCDSEPFGQLWSGRKRCEVRKDDRDYKIGDELRLNERWGDHSTGRQIHAVVTHIQRGYGLPDNLVVMSIVVIAQYGHERI